MTATAFVKVLRIQPCRNDTVFVEGYAWDTDKETFDTFYDAQQRYEVPFEQAAYLIDLYKEENECVETFPISESNYLALIQPESTA